MIAYLYLPAAMFMQTFVDGLRAADQNTNFITVDFIINAEEALMTAMDKLDWNTEEIYENPALFKDMMLGLNGHMRMVWPERLKEWNDLCTRTYLDVFTDLLIARARTLRKSHNRKAPSRW